MLRYGAERSNKKQGTEIKVTWATWNPETGEPEWSWEPKSNCRGMAPTTGSLVTPWEVSPS